MSYETIVTFRTSNVEAAGTDESVHLQFEDASGDSAVAWLFDGAKKLDHPKKETLFERGQVDRIRLRPEAGDLATLRKARALLMIVTHRTTDGPAWHLDSVSLRIQNRDEPGDYMRVTWPYPRPQGWIKPGYPQDDPALADYGLMFWGYLFGYSTRSGPLWSRDADIRETGFAEPAGDDAPIVAEPALVAAVHRVDLPPDGLKTVGDRATLEAILRPPGSERR